MTRENTLLVLWIIFGFLFINALDSILYFIIHFIYFGLFNLGLSYKTMTVLVPVMTFLFYGVTTLILVGRINLKSNVSGIYLTRFPKNLTILFAIIAVVLSPIANKLIGLFSENLAKNENFELLEYLMFVSWFHVGFTISRFSVIIALLIVFLFKLKIFNQQNTK